MNDCLVSFGSNLGDSERTIRNALQELQGRLEEFESNEIRFRTSDFFSTQPIGGPENQRIFVNGAVYFESSLEPRRVLEILHEVERAHGRERRVRWDSRTLDLDLLIYGDTILFESDFQVPHPRMCFRQFVLQPAAQAAPDLVHPLCRVSIQQLLNCIERREFDIVLLTTSPRLDALADAIRQFSSPVFSTATWEELPQLMLNPSPFKLVVIDVDRMEPEELIRNQQELITWQKGPVVLLDIPANDELVSDEIAGELLATIDAMKAI